MVSLVLARSDPTSGASWVVVLVVLLVLFLLYFLPAIVSYSRDHPQANAILVLNLLLGWTLIGWVVACVWAFTAIREDVICIRREDGAPSPSGSPQRGHPFQAAHKVKPGFWHDAKVGCIVGGVVLLILLVVLSQPGSERGASEPKATASRKPEDLWHFLRSFTADPVLKGRAQTITRVGDFYDVMMVFAGTRRGLGDVESVRSCAEEVLCEKGDNAGRGAFRRIAARPGSLTSLPWRTEGRRRQWWIHPLRTGGLVMQGTAGSILTRPFGLPGR